MENERECDWCEKPMEKPFWANIFREFCSLECTNNYLESEGFERIDAPCESAAVKPECRD